MNNGHAGERGQTDEQRLCGQRGQSRPSKYQLIDMESEQVLVSGNCERIGIDGQDHATRSPAAQRSAEIDLPDPQGRRSRRSSTCCFRARTKVIDRHRRHRRRRPPRLDGQPRFTRLCPTRSPPRFSTGHREPPPRSFPLHTARHAAPASAPARTPSPARPRGRRSIDTSFHLTMPPKAYMYAIPYDYYKDYGFRRYGYHGTSHRYVSLRLAKLLGKPVEELKIVSCHLGNGSSLCAVDGRQIGRHHDGLHRARRPHDGHPKRRHRPLASASDGPEGGPRPGGHT